MSGLLTGVGCREKSRWVADLTAPSAGCLLRGWRPPAPPPPPPCRFPAAGAAPEPSPAALRAARDRRSIGRTKSHGHCATVLVRRDGAQARRV